MSTRCPQLVEVRLCDNEVLLTMASVALQLSSDMFAESNSSHNIKYDKGKYTLRLWLDTT